jgi:large subunit ribosomal protein L13
MIIDMTNSLLGRVGTFAAKRALEGEEVVLINVEKAVISGSKPHLKSEFIRKAEMGVPRKGPFQPRVADRFVRRKIRGMLPYKTPRGRAAFERIMCYEGNPTGKEGIKVPGSDVDKLPLPKLITVEEVIRVLK